MKKRISYFVLSFSIFTAAIFTINACSKDSQETVINSSEDAKINAGEEVGELDRNNKWVVTANLPDLFETFHDFNTAVGLNITFVRAEIRQTNPGNAVPRYGIYVFDAQNKNVSASSVTIVGRRAYNTASLGITCSSPNPCSWTDGCSPTEIDGPGGSCVWSCSPCGGDCTKTISN